MSWLEEVNTVAGLAVFGVSTTVGVRYLKLRRGEVEVYSVVDVDAQRFLALWRAHPESYTYDVACGSPTTWPNDAKWRHAVDGFAPGRANPVPLATVWLSEAFEFVRAPWWPPHWGRGMVPRYLKRPGAGFTDGVTRTIWLLTHGATSLPVLIRSDAAGELHRLAGFAERAPMGSNAVFESPLNRASGPLPA